MNIINASSHDIYTVDVQETLMTALAKIDKNKLKCVFVVNSNSELLGVLADGDIRREILKGLSLSVCVRDVCNRGVKFVVSNSLTNWQSGCQVVFDEHPDVGAIPIVDEQMRLLSVVTR